MKTNKKNKNASCIAKVKVKEIMTPESKPDKEEKKKKTYPTLFPRPTFPAVPPAALHCRQHQERGDNDVTSPLAPRTPPLLLSLTPITGRQRVSLFLSSCILL